MTPPPGLANPDGGNTFSAGGPLSLEADGAFETVRRARTFRRTRHRKASGLCVTCGEQFASRWALAHAANHAAENPGHEVGASYQAEYSFRSAALS